MGVALFNFGCACSASLWWRMECLQGVNIGVVPVLGMYKVIDLWFYEALPLLL